MTKHTTMMFQGLQPLSMLIGMGKACLARHDPCFSRVELTLPTKLNRRTAFVSGNHRRVSFKEREDFVIGGYLLALQHPGTRLHDHALHQRQERLDFCHQARCLLLRLLEQARGHLSGLPYHLLSGRDQVLREDLLVFCLLFLSLSFS